MSAATKIEWLVDLLDLIRRTPNLDWLLLTKRIGNWRGRLAEAMKLCAPGYGMPISDLYNWLADWREGSAPTNIWLGATVVNQAEADRDVPKLLAVPARVRFLSMEPLLGPVDLSEWLWGRASPCAGCSKDADCECGFAPRCKIAGESALHQVIVGGESGPKARPMHPDWVRSLRDQSQAAGSAFNFKQWGEWAPNQIGDPMPWPYGDGRYADWMNAFLHHDPEVRKEWFWSFGSVRTGGTVLARIGKQAAGRLLDGRTWDEFPKVVA